MLAVLFYRTWQYPLEVEHGAWVRWGFAVLGMELVSVLAGAFVNGLADPNVEVQLNDVVLQGERHRPLRRRLVVFLSIFFGLAGAVIAIVAGSWLMLIGFSGVMVSRSKGLLANSAEANRIQFKHFAGLLVVFILTLILTCVMPLSKGGLTPEVLAQVYPNGAGLWFEGLERALVLGVIYFGAAGIFELSTARWRHQSP